MYLMVNLWIISWLLLKVETVPGNCCTSRKCIKCKISCTNIKKYFINWNVQKYVDRNTCVKTLSMNTTWKKERKLYVHRLLWKWILTALNWIEPHILSADIQNTENESMYNESLTRYLSLYDAALNFLWQTCKFWAFQ